MRTPNRMPADRYPPAAMALHWLTLLLLILVYATMYVHGYVEGAAGHGTIGQGTIGPGTAGRGLLAAPLAAAHFTLGLGIGGLTLARLLLCRRYRLSAIHPAPPRWQPPLAHAMHGALYLFLAAMPLLGWCTLAASHDLAAPAWLPLPEWPRASPAFGPRLEIVHKGMSHLGCLLVFLHAAAALYHHGVQHDNSLLRMLPARRRRPAP